MELDSWTKEVNIFCNPLSLSREQRWGNGYRWESLKSEMWQCYNKGQYGELGEERSST